LTNQQNKTHPELDLGKAASANRPRPLSTEAVRAVHSYSFVQPAYFTHAIDYDRQLEEAYVAKAHALYLLVSLLLVFSLFRMTSFSPVGQTEARKGRDIQAPRVQPAQQGSPRSPGQDQRQDSFWRRDDVREGRDLPEEEVFWLL